MIVVSDVGIPHGMMSIYVPNDNKFTSQLIYQVAEIIYGYVWYGIVYMQELYLFMFQGNFNGLGFYDTILSYVDINLFSLYVVSS